MTTILAYLRWHFTAGFKELDQFWKNLMWFGYHFFSIPLLLRTLIRPLYRIHESAPPGSGINIQLFFENITTNLIARIIGFFLRVALILIGAVYQIILFLAGPFLFVIWFFAPLMPIALIVAGVNLLF